MNHTVGPGSTLSPQRDVEAIPYKPMPKRCGLRGLVERLH